jgi:hypothetical protein
MSTSTEGRGAGRTARGAPGGLLPALLLPALLLLAAPPAVPAPAPRAARTRADLEAARRRVDLLEAELSLARTRKPYVVLDLESRTLRYALMGMDLRTIPVPDVETRGLVPAGAGKGPDPVRIAAIVSLREKEDDPRLDPLTPEQIEAGEADENAADVLPPEPPAAYDLRFHQPVVVQVAGRGEGGAGRLAAGVRNVLRRAYEAALRRGGRGGVRLVLHLDAGVAREVYRSLVPGERFVIVPPAGMTVPPIGQEAPKSLKAGRRPAAAPPVEPAPAPGVPFQIPPPVDLDAPPAPDADGDEGAPAARPAPGEPDAPAGPGEGSEEDPPLPEDWEPAGEEEPPAEDPPAGEEPTPGGATPPGRR